MIRRSWFQRSVPLLMILTFALAFLVVGTPAQAGCGLLSKVFGGGGGGKCGGLFGRRAVAVSQQYQYQSYQSGTYGSCSGQASAGYNYGYQQSYYQNYQAAPCAPCGQQTAAPIAAPQAPILYPAPAAPATSYINPLQPATGPPRVICNGNTCRMAR